MTRQSHAHLRQMTGQKLGALILGQGMADFADQHGDPDDDTEGQQVHPDRCRIMQVLFVVILVIHGFVLAWDSGARS
nr:MAG TPA: hypothetical protein [Caudoviricetes sp.]